MKNGDRFTNTQGYVAEVTNYIRAKDVYIKFIKTGYETKVRADHLRDGRFKDKLAPIVYGVGYLGEGNIPSWVNGKVSKVYDSWKKMLQRCYDDKYKDKQPTYKGCTVSQEWHDFSKYALWYYGNHPDINNTSGILFQLDKDLLVPGNKIYGEQFCSILPSYINSLLVNCSGGSRQYPLGVHKEVGGKYVAQISKGRYKVHLGHFETIKDAYNRYKESKESYIKAAALSSLEKGHIPQKIYNSLLSYSLPNYEEI